MPVRFRCKHCQQLLGIARRKVGTEVRCPVCHKMVLVPAADAPDMGKATRKEDFLFEGEIIEARLPPAVADPAVGPATPAGASTFSPAPSDSFDAELYRIPDPAPAAGFIFSPLLAVLLIIGAVVVLALAFTVGLLVGRYVL